MNDKQDKPRFWRLRLTDGLGGFFNGEGIMKKLSDRVRPDVEAAPWVVAEIKSLEDELEATKYSLRLDEDLIGMIQKIITVLNNRPTA